MVTLYAGTEGRAPAEMGNTEVAPFSPMYAGLAVCAHDDAAKTTAVFSDVTMYVLQLSGPASNKKQRPIRDLVNSLAAPRPRWTR